MRDTLATGDADGLVAADERTIEFTLAELSRLAQILGGEGFEALAAYLRVLRRETLPDGRRVLLLEEFSGRWLMDHTSLGRNAAYRAQRALEASGMFSRIVGQPGHGARGKDRAVLDPRLVLIAGGADTSVDDLKFNRPTARRVPFSQNPGERENGTATPLSQQVGEREPGPIARSPRNRENGLAGAASSQVRADVPETGRRLSTAPTSSQSPSPEVINCLISDEIHGAGLVLDVLRPAVTRDFEHATAVVHAALNDGRYSEKLTDLSVKLRLEGPSTQHLRQLVEHFAELLIDPELVWHDLTVLGVTFRPRLTAERAVERFIVAVVAALGMRRLAGWGGWLGQAVKPGWVPLANPPLRALLGALRRLEADDERRRELQARSTEVAATGSGSVSVSVSTQSPQPLSEEVVTEHLEDALADPDLVAFARAGNLDNFHHRERVVRIYLANRPEQQARATG